MEGKKEKDDRHLIFPSMDVRLKDPYYLGCEQEKLRDKVRELENSQAQFEKSQAQLIQKNAELSENLESALKLREKEQAQFKEQLELQNRHIQSLFSLVQKLESDINILCSEDPSPSSDTSEPKLSSSSNSQLKAPPACAPTIPLPKDVINPSTPLPPPPQFVPHPPPLPPYGWQTVGQPKKATQLNIAVNPKYKANEQKESPYIKTNSPIPPRPKTQPKAVTIPSNNVWKAQISHSQPSASSKSTKMHSSHKAPSYPPSHGVSSHQASSNQASSHQASSHHYPPHPPSQRFTTPHCPLPSQLPFQPRSPPPPQQLFSDQSHANPSSHQPVQSTPSESRFSLPKYKAKKVFIYGDSNYQTRHRRLRLKLKELLPDGTEKYDLNFVRSYTLEKTLVEMENRDHSDAIVVIATLTNNIRHNQSLSTIRGLQEEIITKLQRETDQSNIVFLACPPTRFPAHFDTYMFNCYTEVVCERYGVRFAESFVKKEHLYWKDGIHVDYSHQEIVAKSVAAAIINSAF